MRNRLLLVLSIILIVSSTHYSQNNIIKRKGQLGVGSIALNDSIIASKNLEIKSGAIVTVIVPNGTAEEIGLRKEDIIVKFNDISIKSGAHLREEAGKIWGKDEVTFNIIRDGEDITLKGKAKQKPLETPVYGEVIYDTTKFQNGYLRVITNRPAKEGKLPAILFIPGYTCVSQDDMWEHHPYKKLIDGWVNEGFVVMRVEKPGMGDCFNTPDCYGLDILEENKAFRRGVDKLLTYDFVDSHNIFVFGHSMGGVTAPFIANDGRIKGVMVYGTIHKAWYEYFLDMLRIQNPMFNPDYITHEKEMRIYHELIYKYLVEKKSPKELAQNAEYKRLLERDFEYDGNESIYSRHYSYWQSVCDLNITEAWANTKSYVYSIWGEADLQSLYPTSHMTIVDIVNHYHPGKGEYYQMQDTDHAFLKVGSMKDDAKLYQSGKIREKYATSFNKEIIEITSKWVKDKIDK